MAEFMEEMEPALSQMTGEPVTEIGYTGQKWAQIQKTVDTCARRGVVLMIAPPFDDGTFVMDISLFNE